MPIADMVITLTVVITGTTDMPIGMLTVVITGMVTDMPIGMDIANGEKFPVLGDV